jgi:hypothetical protein
MRSIFGTDNDGIPTDADIMRSYAIDTLFASEYYTGDTEEIETTDALRAPDSAQFTIAIQKEIHSLIHETKTFIPVTKTLTGYRENSTNRRVWRIRTTLKCKRKKKPNGEQGPRGSMRRHPTSHNDQSKRSTATQLQPYHYAPHFRTLPSTGDHHYPTVTMDIKSAYLNAPLPPDADWIDTTLEPHIAKVCGLDPAQEYRIPRLRPYILPPLQEGTQKGIQCPHSTTASSIGYHRPKLHTSLYMWTTHLYLVTLKLTSIR